MTTYKDFKTSGVINTLEENDNVVITNIGAEFNIAIDFTEPFQFEGDTLTVIAKENAISLRGFGFVKFVAQSTELSDYDTYPYSASKFVKGSDNNYYLVSAL